MFKTDDPIVNLQLMARMVYPEATVIKVTSGPQIEVMFRPRGKETNALIAIKVSDLNAALTNAGIHPLTFFHLVRQRAEARISNYN